MYLRSLSFRNLLSLDSSILLIVKCSIELYFLLNVNSIYFDDFEIFLKIFIRVFAWNMLMGFSSGFNFMQHNSLETWFIFQKNMLYLLYYSYRHCNTFTYFAPRLKINVLPTNYLILPHFYPNILCGHEILCEGGYSW